MCAEIAKTVQTLPEVTILFAGDSGDGMQLTGDQFTLATAMSHNDLATLPDFPAEIRAPIGTTYGVSAFQIQFGAGEIHTPGDEVDLLVAMNPAALKVNLNRVRQGGAVIVNADSFGQRNLDLAKYESNPLEDGSLLGYQVFSIQLSKLTHEALKDTELDKKGIDRSKNMFALGLALWLYSRPIEPTLDWLKKKFGKKPEILDANITVLKAGYFFGETTETFSVRYEVKPAKLPPGTYRSIRGVQALAYGLVAASQESGIDIFYASYPITPASDILHELSSLKHFGVRTFQAEDEIAAMGAAIGSSFGGKLGITGTSGPGLALKGEALGLAVMTELPVVVVNVQRGGPSTGLPTKTEQADLLQAMYGRNGEAPLAIIAPSTPGDCFLSAYEACRIAVKYMVPVILLSDGYLANGSEPWLIPDLTKLNPFPVRYADAPNADVNGEAVFFPYKRDEKTLARPWAIPGTAGLEHRLGGLEKANETGNVSYDPHNHELMIQIREEKVQRITQDIPPTEIIGETEGDLLVLGWGSTRGAIESAVTRERRKGVKVSCAHIRWINPLPADLGDIFSRFDKILIPELNSGQLIRILRDRFMLPFIPFNKVQGQPFRRSEIAGKINEILNS